MRLSSNNKIYSMSPDNKPVLYVKAGQNIIIETVDCYDGMVVSEVDSENHIDNKRINPATGPVFIEDAQLGDTIVVEIVDIKVGNKGIMRISPNFGSLKEMVKGSKFKIMDISEGMIHFNELIKIPVNPMIGVIGTSPSKCSVENESPGDHGGNMDTRNITIGSKVYLPVNVNGGLLALGDIHASMGDGESAGTGVEVCGEVTARIEILKSTNQKRPYVETKEAFYTICSAPTLEEASKQAVSDSVNMIMEKLGICFEDAYMMTSICCNLIISQIVDPLMTVRMEIPKTIFNFI